MVYLLLSVLGSALISIIMRLSSEKVTGNLTMLATNYLMCLTLGAAYAGFQVTAFQAPGFSTAVGMGAANGIFYLSSFILLQYNTQKHGIVLSSVFMKLGLLVPFAMSVLFFHEIPTWLNAAGFLVAVAAIVLMNFEKGAMKKGPQISLVLLLLLGGSANAMSKVFEALGNTALSSHFLFFTFAAAFLLCAGLVIVKRERPGKWDVLFGALIGIPNFFSAKFLLKSLDFLPAVVAYPSFSVGTILIVTVAGVTLFKERLGRRQWIALGAILAALLLLNI